MRALLARVERFARERRAHDPVVRVTLAGGERFSVCAAEPAHGAGFVTLHSHPERYDEMVATEDGGGCRRARSSSRWARSSRSS